MPRPPTRLTLAVLSVAALALAVVAVSREAAPLRPAAPHLLTGLRLCLAILIARLYPVHLGRKLKLTVSTAPLFALTLLLPAPVSLGCAALGFAGSEALRRRPWCQALFNTAQAVLCVGVGELLATGLSGQTVLRTLTARGLLAAGLAAVVMYVVNGLLVDGIISVQLGRPQLGVLQRCHQASSGVEALLFATGLLTALAAAWTPWGLLVGIVPCLLAYRLLCRVTATAVATAQQQLAAARS